MKKFYEVVDELNNKLRDENINKTMTLHFKTDNIEYHSSCNADNIMISDDNELWIDDDYFNLSMNLNDFEAIIKDDDCGITFYAFNGISSINLDFIIL